MYRTVLLLLQLILFRIANAQPAGANLNEQNVASYTLPDVLQTPHGTQVQSAKEWQTEQRPYVYHLYEQIQFGRFPVTSLPLKYRVLERSPHALNGLATRKQIRLYLQPRDTSVIIDLLLYVPNMKKPVPVFVGYNFSGNHAVTTDEAVRAKMVVAKNDTTTGKIKRGGEAAQWQIEESLKHGFAVATAWYGDVEADNPQGWQKGIRSTMQQTLAIEPGQWSAMGAWAYGLKRINDYLQQDDDIYNSKVALIGHSRLGKAALWAGASDERFTLVIANESGEGGAALSKRNYGETVDLITKAFPHWFAPAYKTFAKNTDSLPIDGHMLLSLIAPRPLYVASAVEDQWSDPRGEFLSAKEAGRVYALLGKQGINSDTMPQLNQPVGADVMYHIRSGRHSVTLYDWQQYWRFAENQFAPISTGKRKKTN